MKRSLVFVNLLAFTAVLIVNYLSNSLPLNGKTPAELSAEYPNLFVPAGLTFAIWGVIYTWLLVFVVYQVVALFNTAAERKIAPILEKTGWLFAYTCLLNIGWLLAWHWGQILVSVIIMVNLLYMLTELNRALGIGESASSSLEKWLAHVPFGLYQGWITVALIANVTALLISFSWYGGGIPEAVWASIMIAVGGLLAIYMLFRRNNLGHGLAVAWALFGIYSKRNGALEAGSDLVAMVALGCMIAVLVSAGLRLRRFLTQ